MRRIIIATAMSLCVVCLAAVASPDTLLLRDGTRVEGTVVSIAGRTITFRHAGGESRRYPTSQVESLEFLSAERANPEALSSHRLEAPAGTELTVRTVETIDSRYAGPDQIFSAIFEQDVFGDSKGVLIPEGASAQLLIRHMTSGGTTGSPVMVLDIQSIAIDGRRYLASTADMRLESGNGIGQSKRKAEANGGGAALGTVIGATAGAAVGVLVGAAGEERAPVLTRGHDVQVPSETILKFRLDKAVRLQAER
jgi:hypothetical protein